VWPTICRNRKPIVTPSHHRIRDFRFSSGKTLAELTVEYATIGTPQRNAHGDITNAVLFCHGWSGTYAQGTVLYADLFAPGAPLDPARFYTIFPTALGSPGSSSPSTSKLGADFPAYSIIDMMTAQWHLLRDGLGIRHLSGIVGGSMGGYQALAWMTQHPEMMEWAIVIASAPSTIGRNVGIWHLMSEAITGDPAYADGRYTQQPAAGIRRAFLGTFLWYFATEHYQSRIRDVASLDAALAEAGMANVTMDANDVIWRNRAMIGFDVTANLAQVRARTLVIGVTTDEIFPAEEYCRIVAGIPRAKLFSYASVSGHLGLGRDIHEAVPAITRFLRKMPRP